VGGAPVQHKAQQASGCPLVLIPLKVALLFFWTEMFLHSTRIRSSRSPSQRSFALFKLIKRHSGLLHHLCVRISNLTMVGVALCKHLSACNCKRTSWCSVTWSWKWYIGDPALISPDIMKRKVAYHLSKWAFISGYYTLFPFRKNCPFYFFSVKYMIKFILIKAGACHII
jgi:hypothetical protein